MWNRNGTKKEIHNNLCYSVDKFQNIKMHRELEISVHVINKL